MNLKTNIDAAKVKKYGKSKHALTTAEQTAIFKESLITTQPILDKVTNLLDYVVEANKTTPIVYDEVGFKALLNARWQTNTSDDRKAYDVIEKNDKWAKKAIDKLASANDFDVSKAKSWAKSQFPSDTAIFDHAGLTTADSIRRAASLLNYVKRAEATSGKNANILGKLTTAKNQSNKSAYNAVNGSDGRVDKAITKLEGSSAPSPTVNAEAIRKATEAKATAEIELTNARDKLDKKQKEVDDKIDINSTLFTNLETLKKRTEGIHRLVDSQANPTGSVKGKVDILNSIISRNRDLVDTYLGLNNKVIKTTFDHNNRIYLYEDAMLDVVEPVAKFLTENINKEEFDKSIDAITAYDATAKVAAKKSFEELLLGEGKIETDSYKKAFEANEKKAVSLIKKDGRFKIKDEKNWYKEFVELSEADADLYADLGLKLRGERPKETADLFVSQGNSTRLLRLANFINAVFPYRTFETSELLDSASPNCLKGKKIAENKFEDVLKKELGIKWLGNHTHEANKTFAENNDASADILNLKFTLGIKNSLRKEGIIKLLWDLFNSDVSKTLPVKKYYLKADGSKGSINLTQFENEREFHVVNWYINSFEKIEYVNQIKKTVESAKDKDGNDLNLKFDEEWKKAAEEVFDSAATSWWGEIAKTLEARSNPKLAWNHFSHVGAELSKYDTFYQRALRTQRQAEVAYNNEEKRLEKLTDELSAAQAERDEKDKAYKLAEKNLLIAKGMDLETSKAEFKAVYGDGPRSGSPELLYELQEIDYMFNLLENIEKQEKDSSGKLTGSLNAEFTTYKDELVDKVDQPLKNIQGRRELASWLSLEGTAEERINTFGFRDEETKKSHLMVIKLALESTEKLRKLGPVENVQLRQINGYLSGKREEEREQSVDEWKKIFPGETWLTDDIITKWKATNNFKTKEEFKKLVENVYKDGVFLTYLKDKREMTGVKTWEDLIKQEPATVIGVILYYNRIIKGKNGDQQEVAVAALRKEMKNDNATVSEMENYLQAKAEAEKKKSSSTSEEKTFWEKPAGKITLVVGGFVVLGIIGAIIFWDSIKAWWENTGEEETKKPSKKNK